jgi:hypothetical protein
MEEETNEVLAAVQRLDRKFDDRFKNLEQKFDQLHQSQIKLEGMRSEIQFVSENVAHLKKRFAAWDEGEDDQPSIPVRVSALEVRVSRLEKKKGRN